MRAESFTALLIGSVSPTSCTKVSYCDRLGQAALQWGPVVVTGIRASDSHRVRHRLGGPLWLAGRVAQYGHLLFDDDPAARVAWQADTRLRYVDELPAVRARHRQRREQLARDTGHG